MPRYERWKPKPGGEYFHRLNLGYSRSLTLPLAEPTEALGYNTCPGGVVLAERNGRKSLWIAHISFDKDVNPEERLWPMWKDGTVALEAFVMGFDTSKVDALEKLIKERTGIEKVKKTYLQVKYARSFGFRLSQKGDRVKVVFEETSGGSEPNEVVHFLNIN